MECGICGRTLPLRQTISCSMVRPQLAAGIEADHADWHRTGHACHDDLNEYRRRNVEASFGERRGIGDRIADKVAKFGGGWSFILSISAFLVVWTGFNALAAGLGQFDPYPFILLNLLLSSIAAFQAPIIMMSQRRQEEKDRARSENDYRINLKAELEIRHLHEKIDHLLMRRWERLTEIQQVQLELMEDIAGKRSADSAND